jgi:hypothetical protein
MLKFNGGILELNQWFVNINMVSVVCEYKYACLCVILLYSPEDFLKFLFFFNGRNDNSTLTLSYSNKSIKVEFNGKWQSWS